MIPAFRPNRGKISQLTNATSITVIVSCKKTTELGQATKCKVCTRCGSSLCCLSCQTHVYSSNNRNKTTLNCSTYPLALPHLASLSHTQSLLYTHLFTLLIVCLLKLYQWLMFCFYFCRFATEYILINTILNEIRLKPLNINYFQTV